MTKSRFPFKQQDKKLPKGNTTQCVPQVFMLRTNKNWHVLIMTLQFKDILEQLRFTSYSHYWDNLSFSVLNFNLEGEKHPKNYQKYTTNDRLDHWYEKHYIVDSLNLLHLCHWRCPHRKSYLIKIKLFVMASKV